MFKEVSTGKPQEYGSYVKRFAHSPHYLSAVADMFALKAHDHFLNSSRLDLLTPRRIPGRPYPERTGMRFPPSQETYEPRSTGEMRQPMEIEAARLEGVVCNSDPWEPRIGLAPNGALEFQTLSARCVELIAQPGKIQELRDCVQSRLMDYLKKQRGFAGAVILSSLKEPRLILVMSLWKGEKDAGNRWEASPAALRLISPMIDVCTRVHTYEAALTNLEDCRAPVYAPPLC